MKINWDKFTEWTRKTGIHANVSYKGLSVGETAHMILEFDGTQADMSKILNILMTHWDKKGKWR